MNRYRFFIVIFLLLCYSLVYGGEIAISIDDAPMGDSQYMSADKRSQLIIKGLAEKKVKAIFYVTTRHIDKSGERRLRQYANAGHWLAHHSHSHRSANKLNKDEYMADFNIAQSKLAKFNNTLQFHRFPYLHYGKNAADVTALQNSITKAGYRDGYVTVDTAEWYLNKLLVEAADAGHDIDTPDVRDYYIKLLWQTIEYYDGLAKQSLGRSPKHILLLHENDTTALFLPSLIDKIRKEGWQVISPIDAYKDAIGKTVPATPMNKQGRVAALAHIKGVAEKDLKSPFENLDIIKKEFLAIISADKQ